MSTERRERVDAICLEALSKDGRDRDAFLEQACGGDADLRRAVERLLAGQARAGEFLETPAWAEATPLAPGSRLGPYEILSMLGAGGMGEVYKARDTRLGRTVALKVLPLRVASDPDRRRRFEQEARAASALNHPYICTVYDIGEAAPSSADEQAPGAKPLAPVHYLVMEHLEGQTLAARLAKGRLPLQQALDIGIQIADALSAAHKHGIVHRDLKPGNVMLTKVATPGTSGVHAKLLDFGLAKLKAPQAGAGAASLAGTEPSSITAPGMLLGTLPYMAPEQIEGKETDARTDLWALGAMLYEMLAGRRAFEGHSQASLIGNIMNAEPPALPTLQPLTPPSLDRVITKCLAKHPDDRWDTAHDVADELRWVSQTSGAGAVAGVRRRRTGGVWIAAAVSGVLLVFAAGAGLMSLLRPAALPTPPAHLSLDVRPAEELNAGGTQAINFLPTPGGSRTALTWTPDGRALVFVGRRGGVQQLYVRRLDAAEARPLAGTEGAQVPAVSPDGQWIAFWAGGAIRKVPVGGGPAMDLAPGITIPPQGLVWDERGQLYFGGQPERRIWRIPAEGTPKAVTTLGEAEYTHGLPWPLPGGHTLLYTVRRLGFSWGHEEIVAQSLTTGERTPVLSNAADARYLSTRHLVFLRQGRLFAVAFDPNRSQVSGKEVPVLSEVAQALAASSSGDVTGAGQFAVSGAGTLAWIPGPVASYRNATLVAVDRQGRVTPLPAQPQSYTEAPRISPDGQRVAVAIRGLTETSLWLYDLRRGGLTLVTRNGEAELPLWSPDGQRLVFTWRLEGGWGLAVWSADGVGPPTMVVKGDLVPTSFTPDGRQLALVREAKDIVVASLDGQKATVRPLMETETSETSPEFSPDGKWLAYVSNASGRAEVYVQPFPGPGPVQPVSTDGGISPAWHPTGHELFFLSPPDAAGRRSMMAVDFGPGSPPRIGRPHLLFSFNGRELAFMGSPVRFYDVAPDGQRFYTIRHEAPAPPPVVTHISLIENWFEELKAKVPASPKGP